MHRAPRGPISRNAKHIAFSRSGPAGRAGLFLAAKCNSWATKSGMPSARSPRHGARLRGRLRPQGIGGAGARHAGVQRHLSSSASNPRSGIHGRSVRPPTIGIVRPTLELRVPSVRAPEYDDVRINDVRPVMRAGTLVSACPMLASLRLQRPILRGGSEHRTRQAPTR
jgi:hypothetical protein